ncbi:DUF4913 domain-containing protein [Streptomyces sp. NPDC001530]|uniref:DUF4913 domain-containing protein n=1 Tax=Streptomyces sp. NPDC001530 TaxID=3364582 RepID=UPI0036901B18
MATTTTERTEYRNDHPCAGSGGTGHPEPTEEQPQGPAFVLHPDDPEYDDALNRLALWVRHLLLPVYGREVTSAAPWRPSWWKHPEAVAQPYGLWTAWQELTGPTSGSTGPAT